MTRHGSPSHATLNSEQTAVLAVIEADTDAYLRRDRDAWEACWLRDDRFASMMDCGGLIVSRGYDAFRDTIFAAMDHEDAPSPSRVARENLSIQIVGDIAWAVYDQVIARDTADAMDPPSLSQNLRILRRTPDGWRIAVHGV